MPVAAVSDQITASNMVVGGVERKGKAESTRVYEVKGKK